MVEETLSLVDAHYPQIDTAAVRRRLSLSRRMYDVPARMGIGNQGLRSGE
jgi:hypothetical protein